jgi:hypothetical protein
MLIASFDIGEKNFAYCIAEYIEKHTTILKIIHQNVIIKKAQSVIESCINVSILMDADEKLMACDRFIIEQQMRSNIRSQRLAQHVWSTIHAKFPDRIIKFVPSYMKMQHFIGKNTLKDKQRKQWSINKVIHEGVMSVSDHHTKIIEDIINMKKKDDVCDTILQVIAYIDREVR